jgi:hypothetical protein
VRPRLLAGAGCWLAAGRGSGRPGCGRSGLVFVAGEEVGVRGLLRRVRRACWSLNKERKNIDASFVRPNLFVVHMYSTVSSRLRYIF